MPIMNFDLEDGLPPVSFSINNEGAERFMNFMAECTEMRDAGKAALAASAELATDQRSHNEDCAEIAAQFQPTESIVDMSQARRIIGQLRAQLKRKSEPAASAPKVQMTDDEIIAQYLEFDTWPKRSAVSEILLNFARAIVARSAPNAELVAALSSLLEVYEETVNSAYCQVSENSRVVCDARAALAAVGENHG